MEDASHRSTLDIHISTDALNKGTPDIYAESLYSAWPI